jgi:hypothetical protein
MIPTIYNSALIIAIGCVGILCASAGVALIVAKCFSFDVRDGEEGA